MQSDPTTCDYIRPDLEYEALEGRQAKLQGDPSTNCCAQFKEELEYVKQRLDSVVAEVCKQKCAEDSRKMQIVIDSSVLVPC